MQVAKQAAKITEKEAHDTEEEYKMGNAAMATYKASQAAWKASQAAEAAAEAEQSALEASMHARNARTVLALDNSLSASQAYNQVCTWASPYFVKLRTVVECLARGTRLCTAACDKL